LTALHLDLFADLFPVGDSGRTQFDLNAEFVLGLEQSTSRWMSPAPDKTICRVSALFSTLNVWSFFT
jgi:hypothetical protein